MIRPVLNYSFINAKIHGKKSKFLSAGDYERMYNASSIDELSRLISSSRFGNDNLNQLLLSGNKINSILVDRHLSEMYLDEVHNLAKNIPKYAEEFMKAVLNKVYIDALKTIIRGKHAGFSKDKTLEFLIIPRNEETSRLDYMIDLPNIPQIIEAVPEQWIKSRLIEGMADYEQTNSILPLEQALNNALYNRIWQKSKNITTDDQKGSFNLIGAEVDLINLMVILRCKNLEIDLETTKRWLIPIKYRLSKQFLETIAQVSMGEVANRLLSTTYRDLVKESQELFDSRDLSVTKFETVIQQYLAHKAIAVLRGTPFHLGIFFAWSTLALTETKNIRAIIVGKLTALEPELIRNELIYF